VLTRQKFLGFLLTTVEHVTYIARVAREVLRHGLADE
jgi:hypothetical protein